MMNLEHVSSHLLKLARYNPERCEIIDKKSMCEWVSSAQNGDEQAFSILYQNYYRFAYQVAYKLTNCDADAKDAVQLAFIQVQKSIGNLKKPDFFPLWLHRIVTSKCKDLFRANRYVTYDDEYFQYFTKAIEHRSYMLADKQMHFDSDRDVFMELFINMKEELQEVLWLFYFEDKKISEMADMLGVNENTIKSRMRRAKELLKESVQKYEQMTKTKLDFHEEVIGAMLATSILANLPWKKTKFHNGLISMRGFMLILSTIIIGTTSVYGFYRAVQGQNQNPKPRGIIKFSKENNEVTEAKNAYFNLCNWTFDKNDMKSRSEASIAQMKLYYESLKKQGGVYYKTLVDTGWAETFEAL